MRAHVREKLLENICIICICMFGLLRYDAANYCGKCGKLLFCHCLSFVNLIFNIFSMCEINNYFCGYLT